MKTIKEIAKDRKSRKGPAACITPGGAYWVPVCVAINYRGGDGIGSAAPQITEELEIRHYRHGSIQAVCKTVRRHQNTCGARVDETRCNAVLKCDTVEALITRIKRLPDADGGYFSVSADGAERLTAELSDLPAALPAPENWM